MLVVDLGYALVLFATRDREIVNRWTSRVLAVNLVLAGTGIGVPMLALERGWRFVRSCVSCRPIPPCEE